MAGDHKARHGQTRRILPDDAFKSYPPNVVLSVSANSFANKHRATRINASMAKVYGIHNLLLLYSLKISHFRHTVVTNRFIASPHRPKAVRHHATGRDRPFRRAKTVVSNAATDARRAKLYRIMADILAVVPQPITEYPDPSRPVAVWRRADEGGHRDARNSVILIEPDLEIGGRSRMQSPNQHDDMEIPFDGHFHGSIGIARQSCIDLLEYREAIQQQTKITGCGTNQNDLVHSCLNTTVCRLPGWRRAISSHGTGADPLSEILVLADGGNKRRSDSMPNQRGRSRTPFLKFNLRLYGQIRC